MEKEIQTVMDIFEGGFAPEEWEDSEPIDFSQPIRGKYVCELDDLTHGKGEGANGPWEYLKLKLKVVEDAEGDKSFNRFLDKTFWLGTNDWNDDPLKGLKDLASTLNTAGIKMPKEGTVKGFLSESESWKGAKLNVSAYPGKEDQSGKRRQICRVVKEFKSKADEKQPAFDLPV